MKIVHIRTDEEAFLKHTFAHSPDAYTPSHAWDNEKLQLHLYSDRACTKVIPGTYLKHHFYEVHRFHDTSR